MEKRKEPGVNEKGKYVPNRIFRGRIVEFARKNQGKEIFISDLGKKVKKDYNQKEEIWLLMLCEKLKNEKLLYYHISKSVITLFLPQ